MNNWPVKVTDQYLPLRDPESVPEDWGTDLGPLKCRYPHTLLTTPVYPSYKGGDLSLEPQLKSPASGSTNNVFTSLRRADQPAPPSIHWPLPRRARRSKITNHLRIRHGGEKQSEGRELDNTRHKSTSSGTTKQRIMGSYSGSASTTEDVLGKRGEESSGNNEEYDGRGWGPRPDAGSVVRRNIRRVSVRGGVLHAKGGRSTQ